MATSAHSFGRPVGCICRILATAHSERMGLATSIVMSCDR
ncbi:hypothetical protein trd_0029 [Thermomicrobium roseum DSM 5159]|uniref:Uncharacterized protein n=1 Tax=Thermomicrobium roseum (strain ATCC 27502 / DSM 5159 / P-2) TaxID=309801 RepID=B9L1C8_THERP|nr:hypothetical protein trd_0029 [Thermomicrobium roseum DSM 5159]